MTALSAIPATTPPHSNPVPVIFGAFKTVKTRLPYFTCVMSLQDVASYFRLADDIPKYQTMNWKLQELYQRSLNRERVHDIANRYLRSVDGRPAFFNAITIALAAQPDAPTLDPQVVKFQDSHNISLPGIALATQRVESVKGYSVPASGSIGQASWVLSPRLNAVAIDGQHRLAAIKKFAAANTSDAQESYVSIIVLMLHEKLGFYAPRNPNTMDAMRGVFIDLNKHAIPVATARNILLDDASLHAACIRSLMSDQLQLSETVDPDPARPPTYGTVSHAAGEFDIKVPLAMIDWHGESKSKIDEGPYVTSVLALKWWANRLLKSNSKAYRWDLPTGFDPDESEPYKAFASIANKAGLSDATKSRILDSERASPPIPFHFNTAEINDIGQVFGKRWGRAVVTLLCCLEPYRQLILLRERANTIGEKFSQWYQCLSEAEPYKGDQSEIARELNKRLEDVREELKSQGVNVNEYQSIVQEIGAYKKSSVFFLLVAQRALVISFVELIDDADALRTMCELMGEPTESASTDGMSVVARYIVEALNALGRASPEMFTRGFASGDKPFWSGSILNPVSDNLVDFSERASTRTSVWIVLMAHLYWYERSGNRGCAQSLINAHFERKPFVETQIQLWCNQAISKLIPPVKSKVDGNTFLHSPINYLVGQPKGKVTEAWKNERNDLAKSRLSLITTAAKKSRL